MITEITIKYLTEKQSAPVYAEVPEKPPARFIVVDKTGERQENRIKTATVAIQAYATSKLDAARLNEEIKTVMDGINILPEIGGVHIETDYYFPNTATKKYRYQAVYQITYY